MKSNKLIRIELVFPDKLIKAPVIYIAAKKFNLVPNIFSAEITETKGKVELELEGKIIDLKQAIRYFERKGIGVKQKYEYKKI